MVHYVHSSSMSSFAGHRRSPGASMKSLRQPRFRSRSSSDERRARRSKTEAQPGAAELGAVLNNLVEVEQNPIAAANSTRVDLKRRTSLPGSVRSSRSKEESKGAKNAKEEDKVRPSAYKRKPNPSVQRVETPDQTQAASSEPPQMGAYRSRKQNQEASPVAEAGTNGVQGTAPLKPDKEAAPETRSSSYRRKQNPAAAAAPASAETAPAEAATSEEIARSPPSPAEQEVVPEPRSSGYRRKQNPSAAAETPPADPMPVTAPAEAATSEDVAGSAPSQVEQEVVAEPRSSAYRRKQNPSAAAETPPADPTPVAAPAEAISEDVAGSPASQTSHEEPTRTRSAYRNRKPNASEPSTPQETSDAPAPRSSSYRQRRQSSSKPRRGSRQDQPLGEWCVDKMAHGDQVLEVF